MARNSKATTGNDFGHGKEGSGNGGFRPNIKRWISPYLDKADLNWLESNRDNQPQFVFEFLHELPVGYTLSSKFDDKTDRWLTTCICDALDDPNKGLALTARGSTRLNSLYTLAYLCASKLEWRWEQGATEAGGDFG